MDRFSREEDLMSGLTSNTLTCPSCRICIIPTRLRTMCPFCGSFYDPAEEDDVTRRIQRHHINRSVGGGESILDGPSQDRPARGHQRHHRRRDNKPEEIPDPPSTPDSPALLRLPRIAVGQGHSIPRSLTTFAPFITDGLEFIHTYMTSLLFRTASNPLDEARDFYLTLPPISHSTEEHQELPPTTSSSHLQLDPSNILGRHNSRKSSSATSSESSLCVPSLSYPEREKSFSELINDVKSSLSSGDYSQVHDFYQRTFSSPLELLALLKRNPQQDGAKLSDPEINQELLHAIYDHLDDLPSFITKSVLKGIIASLSSSIRLRGRDDTRFLFMLLQNPLFGYQSSYCIFAHLLKRIVLLSTTDHQLLINWFSQCDPLRFKILVKRLLQFITIREFPPANGLKLPPIGKSRWWIPSATRVLALLYASNNKIHPNLISYTEFYNSALDHINLMAEYYRWQNPGRSNKFSYCQYPFILSIVAKKIIFQKDSEHQMILHARRSLLNRAIHRQMPDIDVFFLNLNVRRSHLLSDSLSEISRKQMDLMKKLKVTFVGEPGLDMGGLTKEWFLLLIKEIFAQNYGMFVYHKQSRCYWFSTTQSGNLREYHLIGVLTGLAVYNSIILELNFPIACYKKLFSPPIVPQDVDSIEVGQVKTTLDDFAEVMPDVAVGLKQLLAYEGCVEEDFCLTFQVSVQEFGEVKTHVLKPGGENIPVTNDSREEFVQLYMDLIMNKAIFQAFKAFYLGFHSVCDSNALIMLRPEEVETLICGGPTIDMEELRKVTVYDGFYENDPLIKEFWKIVKSFSPDLQKAFLRFVTGSDRIPVGGMSEMTFKISANHCNTDMLPTSHTCFNQLVLPRYKNRQTLREKLVIAISNAEGFGLE